jgi:Na+-transporting NADH:ubiquinone oxidoreductase subunit A
MTHYRIKQGFDLKVKGAASSELVELPRPPRVAIFPSDYRHLKPRLLVREGERVLRGTPLLINKDSPSYHVVAPVSGAIVAIQRGDRRAIEKIVIEPDGKDETVSFPKVPSDRLATLSRDEITSRLIEGGAWPFLRQRPFSRIADPTVEPRSIFVRAMSTDPLSLDPAAVIDRQRPLFAAGLSLLRKLTPGKIRLCYAPGTTSPTLREAIEVEHHVFEGPHPAGNVGVHIHHIDPLAKGDVVWYIDAEDVARLASLFIDGAFLAERHAVITGEAAGRRVRVRTVLGAALGALAAPRPEFKAIRFISGSVLNGRDAGSDGFLHAYDAQLHLLPAAPERRFMRWAMPGLFEHSLSNTFVGGFLARQREHNFDTDQNGSHRAIVATDIYDRYVPLEIDTVFLLKAIIANELEEAEALGLLECDEEDFALASYACPSKTDVGAIIRKGLDAMEREG